MQKILVIRLSSIGDIILTTPLIRRISAAFPAARIDYCTKAPFVQLLSSNPRLSRAYSSEELPQGRYDLVVDLQNNIRSRRIIRTVQAPRVVRYRKENWKKWMLVQFKINLYGKPVSVVERYEEGLLEFGVENDLQGCELYLSEADRAYADRFFTDKQKTLALCFGAKHFTKRYPPARFASILQRLLHDGPLQVLLLGGSEDATHATEIMSELPDAVRPWVLNLAGECSLMQTAALLERSDAVLSNDTGLMHMASAFGKKLFVLFGSSSTAFGFLPYHTPFELFEVNGLACRPCSHIGRERCPKGHFRCMTDLKEQEIAGRILDYFSNYRQPEGFSTGVGNVNLIPYL
ncbi:MAG: glycosyltransferase family 9 protein [Chlorobiaceae bacterium]